MSTVEEEESQLKTTNISYLRQKEKSGKGKSSMTRSAMIKSNLYKDLDRLEESLDADFEKHLAEVRAAYLKNDKSNLTDYDNNETKRSTTMSVSRQLQQQQQEYYDDDDRYYDNDNNNSVETESILGGLEHVPFVGDILPPFGSRPSSVQGLSDVSIHSDKEILGELLLTQSHGKENHHINDQERSRRKGRQGTNNNSMIGSGDEVNNLGRQRRTSNHQWIPNRDLVDEKYSVTPLVNPVITTTASKTTPLTTRHKKNKEGSSAGVTSRSHHRHPAPRAVSPGQYFAARSLPLDSFDEIWNNNNNNNSNSNSNKKKVIIDKYISISCAID